MSSTTPGNDPEGRDEHTDPVDDRADADEAAATPDDTDTGVAADAGRSEPVGDDGATPTAAEPVEPVVPDEGSDDLAVTSRLDEAVERANAHAPEAETNGIDDADSAPEPVPADAVRRETYVPAATVATGTAAGAATLADDRPEPVFGAQPSGPQTIYVQAPTPPKLKGNRGFGILVALIGTVVFGLLYGGISYLLYLGYGAPAGEAVGIVDFLVRPIYWVPVVAFFLGFTLLAAIINRGPWWTYAVFGLFVGVLVYFAYIGGSLLAVEAWTLTLEQANDFIAERWLDPYAIVAAVVAREIPIWFGGWIAARGRAVTERNRLALEAYDRELAAGPQVQRY
ncbi:hypothetical protein [Agromyces subbeticus]|uniref:hypothetical protein n=1 Tax=Agromyces subbeticus TaxID=293890 RepID=UPI0003B57206|nr:hypothetical protein [Agromyces subbeticus]